MTPEGMLWNWLKRQLDKLKTNEVHYDRIENIYGTGIPDTYICYLGKHFWLELKVKPNKVSPNQKTWHRRYRRVMGNVWTVTLNPKTKTLVWENDKEHFITAQKNFDIESTLKELTK